LDVICICAYRQKSNKNYKNIKIHKNHITNTDFSPVTEGIATACLAGDRITVSGT
jgi:hypothetical protein